MTTFTRYQEALRETSSAAMLLGAVAIEARAPTLAAKLRARAAKLELEPVLPDVATGAPWDPREAETVDLRAKLERERDLTNKALAEVDRLERERDQLRAELGTARTEGARLTTELRASRDALKLASDRLAALTVPTGEGA